MMFRLLLLLAFTMVLSVGQAQDTLTLWATYYYVPSLTHDPQGVDLRNAQEEPTGLRLSACDWCTAAIEGTVMVERAGSYHLLNYAGRSDSMQQDCRRCPRYASYGGYARTGRVLWEPSTGYGLGVRNWQLVPYKTVAVDPALIPYGTVLYIAEAVGVAFVDAQGDSVRHDGYFFAGDTGGGIRGNHIDVFLGTDTLNPFAFIQSDSSGTFAAIEVTDSRRINALRALHGVPLE